MSSGADGRVAQRAETVFAEVSTLFNPWIATGACSPQVDGFAVMTRMSCQLLVVCSSAYDRGPSTRVFLRKNASQTELDAGRPRSWCWWSRVRLPSPATQARCWAWSAAGPALRRLARSSSWGRRAMTRGGCAGIIVGTVTVTGVNGSRCGACNRARLHPWAGVGGGGKPAGAGHQACARPYCGGAVICPDQFGRGRHAT